MLKSRDWDYCSGALTLAIVILALHATAQAQTPIPESAPEEQVETTNAVLRTATIYVKDWDASLRFYTQHLGYDVLVEQPINAEKSLQTIGARAVDSARIAYLKPNNSLIERPFAGNYLALIEIKGSGRDELEYVRSPDPTVAMRGEIVLAHQVIGIDDMFKAMQVDEDVLVVAPLSLSGAGLSRSFSVIDPNGVRVEIYEYIPGKEPAENP